MAESDEHKFLSSQTIELLASMSKTGLYGFKETDRKKFDFTCDLVRDWSRLVSGQTLWKHSEGIDKDLRILLADEESKITLYVARDTVQNRRAVHEIITDTKKTPMRDRLHRLRAIWIPHDFDADSEVHRNTIAELLKERLSRDLLISIVLGDITSRDIEPVGSRSGIPGLNLAIMESIAREGFFNITNLGKRLSVSATTVRGRVHVLAASGLLDQPNPKASMCEVSTKGKVILDVCRSIALATEPSEGLTPEFLYILDLLGLRYVDGPVSEAWILGDREAPPFRFPSPEALYKSLVFQSIYATSEFGIDWGAPFFNANGDPLSRHP